MPLDSVLILHIKNLKKSSKSLKTDENLFQSIKNPNKIFLCLKSLYSLYRVKTLGYKNVILKILITLAVTLKGNLILKV